MLPAFLHEKLQKYFQQKSFISPIFLFVVCRQVEMAHKVLSKDMSDLVNSMKLAQKYNNTTVEGDYRKYVIAHPILTRNCRKFKRKVLHSSIFSFYIKYPAKTD